MAWKILLDRKETLMGRTDQGRVIWPSIRGSIRRKDPDVNSTEPYYTGLNGTTIVITLDGDVVSSTTINFTSDSYAGALTAINAAAPVDIKAEDDNGYLRITSLHGGNKNSLLIASGSAAPVLGFEVDPIPGSLSVAGEIATSGTGWPVQSNDQLTRLICKDEGLNSNILNRAFGGILSSVDVLINNLDREFAVPKVFTVTIDGNSFSFANNVTDRFFIAGSTSGPITIPNPTADQLDKHITILDSQHNQLFVNDTRVRVTSVTYGNFVTNASSYTDWNTADGKSVFGDSSHWLKTKTSGTITQIKGNVIKLSGAACLTRKVMPGDTLLISNATNNTPFNHNGSFTVEAVHSNEYISVKPKGSSEANLGSLFPHPSGLNLNIAVGEIFGTGTIVVGQFVPLSMPATQMVFTLNQSLPNGSYKVILPVGRTMRNMLIDDISLFTVGREFGGQIELGSKLQSASDALKPRIIMPISANQLLTLLGEFPTNAPGNPYIRIYAGQTGNLSIMLNARFDSVTGFNKDINGLEALSCSYDAGSLSIYSRKAADNAAWLLWDEVASFPVNDSTISSVSKIANGLKVGNTMISDATKALVPRIIYNTRVSDVTCLTSSARAGTTYREYSTDAGRLLTHNASWDGTKWVRDSNTEVSVKWLYKPYGIDQYTYSGNANDFIDTAWTAKDDFYNYQVDDDFIDYVPAFNTDNTAFGKFWTTGNITNAAVGSLNPALATGSDLGNFGISPEANGAYFGDVYLASAIQLGARDFMFKCRLAIVDKAQIKTLANTGFFIGFYQSNDTPPPTNLMTLGFACGSDTGWKLRSGASNALVHTDLATAVTNNQMISFSLEKFGEKVYVYINNTLIGNYPFSYNWFSSGFNIRIDGTATDTSLKLEIDYIRIWVARPH